MPKKQVSVIRESFFQAVFCLLGYIAKSDGPINRSEIRRTEVYMEKMDLTPECKEEARELFKIGASPDFNASATLQEFQKTAAKSPSIVEILLVYLISMARTDGLLVEREMRVVTLVATELGYSSIVFEHLLKMIAAQDEFENEIHDYQYQGDEPEVDSQKKDDDVSSAADKSVEQGRDQKDRVKQKTEEHSRRQHHRASHTDPYINAAFSALDVAVNATAADIKKAYRKMASRYHPDKLVAGGMPEDLVNTATERFKKIQAAYAYIRTHSGRF